MRPLLALALAALPVLADETAERIRSREAAFAPAIVCMKFVVTSEDGSEEGEGRCTGVAVRRGEGIVVVAGLVDAVMKSAHFVLPGGKEVEARVAGRDEDLGLMFVVPAEGAVLEAKALDFSKGEEAKLGDPLVLIDRRAESPEDAYCRDARVICVLESPRKAYLYSGLSPDNVGALVVKAEGGVVGIVGMSKGTDADGDPEALPACLPASQILEAVTAMDAP